MPLPATALDWNALTPWDLQTSMPAAMIVPVVRIMFAQASLKTSNSDPMQRAFCV
jgi:hypothetical protein